MPCVLRLLKPEPRYSCGYYIQPYSCTIRLVIAECHCRVITDTTDVVVRRGFIIYMRRSTYIWHIGDGNWASGEEGESPGRTSLTLITYGKPRAPRTRGARCGATDWVRRRSTAPRPSLQLCPRCASPPHAQGAPLDSILHGACLLAGLELGLDVFGRLAIHRAAELTLGLDHLCEQEMGKRSERDGRGEAGSEARDGRARA